MVYIVFSTARGRRLRRLPLIIESTIVSNEEDVHPPTPLLFKKGVHRYPGFSFRKGFVYGEEHGIRKVFVRRIAGLSHIFHGKRDLASVNGNVEGIVFNGLDVAVDILLPKGFHSVVLLSTEEGIVERMDTVEVGGLFHKKKYIVNKASLGMSGDYIVTLIKTTTLEGRLQGPSILLIKKGIRGGLSRKILSQRAVIGGWNGLFTAIWEVIDKTKKHIYVHLIKGGKYKRYSIDGALIKPEFIRSNSIVYGDFNKIITYDDNSVYAISLSKNSILWKRDLGTIVCISKSYEGDELLVVTKDKLYVLTIDRGIKLVEKDIIGDKVNACSISSRAIALSYGDYLALYTPRGEEIGKYVVDGYIHGLSSYEDKILIGYVSPANIPKASLVSLEEGIEVALKDVSLTAGTSGYIDIEHVTPRIRIIRSSSRRLRVYSIGSRIVFRDEGVETGVHYVDLVIEAHGFMPLSERIKVSVKKPVSAFTKVSITPKVLKDGLGYYVLVDVETPMHLDVVKAVLYSRDYSLYGSTSEIFGLTPGRHSIPVRLLWARSGIHEATLNIISWSHARRFSESLRSKIVIENDILSPELRIHRGYIHLWSPIDLSSVKLVFIGEGFERTLLTNLKKGWNMFDLGEFIPSKVVIITRSKTSIEVRRTPM